MTGVRVTGVRVTGVCVTGVRVRGLCVRRVSDGMKRGKKVEAAEPAEVDEDNETGTTLLPLLL